MKIPGGEHIHQCIHFLNQSSATFKNWWNAPGKHGELSRKEQFQQLFEQKTKSVERALESLETYLKRELSSRHAKVPDTASTQAMKASMPEGSLAKVVTELDAVLKEYSAKPLPKPPLQNFPKAIHLPPKPLPKVPTVAASKPLSKPLPPIPSEKEKAETHITALKQDLEDALEKQINTFQRAKTLPAKDKPFLRMAEQRIEKPQQPLPTQPDAIDPLNQPKPMAPPQRRPLPPRRKAPEREKSNVDSPAGRPAKLSSEPAKGPSELEQQDFSDLMRALVKVQMDKALLRDVLLGDTSTSPMSQERKTRAIHILKERGIIAKHTPDTKALDRLDAPTIRELVGILEANEKKLQKTLDSWYEKHGGDIRF